MAALRPTENSGVEVAAPRTKKEIRKEEISRRLASLSMVVTIMPEPIQRLTRAMIKV
jgi:hypothetical protein